MRYITKYIALSVIVSCIFPAMTATARADGNRPVVLSTSDYSGSPTNPPSSTLLLKKADGKLIEVPADLFSKQDRRLFQGVAEGKTEETAQSAGPSGLKAEVVSLSITKGEPVFDKAEKYNPDAKESMKLQILVTSLGKKKILSFDRDSSKLLVFSDDRNNSLLKEKDGSQTASFWPFLEYYGLGRQCMVTVNSPCKPAPGTKQLHLKANLAFECAAGKAVTETHKITPAKGGKFTFSKTTVKYSNKASNNPLSGLFDGAMNEAFSPNTKASKASSPSKQGRLTLRISSNDNIESWAFYDADGKRIPSQEVCSSSSGAERTVEYQLAKEVKTLTVKVSYYKDTEIVTLPVDLKVDMGL